jgi:hypothetical protein
MRLGCEIHLVACSRQYTAFFNALDLLSWGVIKSREPSAYSATTHQQGGRLSGALNRRLAALRATEVNLRERQMLFSSPDSLAAVFAEVDAW